MQRFARQLLVVSWNEVCRVTFMCAETDFVLGKHSAWGSTTERTCYGASIPVYDKPCWSRAAWGYRTVDAVKANVGSSLAEMMVGR
jgi:hypothetical protein